MPVRTSEQGFEAEFRAPLNRNRAFVDIDELISDNNIVDLDDDSFFGSDDDEEDSDGKTTNNNNQSFYQNPNMPLMKNDAQNIPGSPWAKPPVKQSNRPKEPLPIAKFASTLAFALSIGWVALMFVLAIWNFSNVGRIIVEIILAILSFFGLFWNIYFVVSSLFKCFIPAQAFRQNTKYCSLIPEKKHPADNWLDVTIQIPVYKESLKDVIMPTLKSCLASRNHYVENSHANCNIVMCDDGIMAFLKDNFAAAEMLWDSIVESEGKILKLGSLLKRVPRPSRRHLKGLRSKSVYEVFHRMLFYYHYNIGWVSRSTVDRRGKFKKASNINTHLQLFFEAQQVAENQKISLREALLEVSHTDGSRHVMFGNDVSIGALIVVNDADARMQPPVILKTVPEFLNDQTLGFTQHATKTMDDQRGESYFLNMLAVYTDSLYQGHFLLSSILGCHPPLVGHSIFLRSEAVKQCGRMRTLRKAQQWLKNIGLPFLSVDQVGLVNLQKASATEYWSESHVSEDFELMIHLYNLGYNGRYVAYPDCEFQEGVTRTFDEEAGRHRKFSLGAHELIFNPLQDMMSHGIFTPLFKTFLTCDIPSYYKIYLTAYLFSYTAGGNYIIVFTIASIVRIVGDGAGTASLWAVSPASILILNILAYYVIGYTAFIIAIVRMHVCNRNIFFQQYRKIYKICLIWKHLRFGMLFQILFYFAMGNYFFLGSMDHLLSRNGIVSATNKDLISIGRCKALWEVATFNSGSWFLAFVMMWLSYATYLASVDWDYTHIPGWEDLPALLFAAPTIILSLMAFVAPIILNPFVLGWPFLRQQKPVLRKKVQSTKSINSKRSVNSAHPLKIDQFMEKTTQKLNQELQRTHEKEDVELGSLATKDLGGGPLSTGNGTTGTSDKDLLNAAYWRNLGGDVRVKDTNTDALTHKMSDAYRVGDHKATDVKFQDKLQDRTNNMQNHRSQQKFAGKNHRVAV